MKKLSVLLVAAAVAISASAGVNFKNTHVLKSNKISTERVKTSVKKNQASIRSAFKAPEGELKSYNRAGYYVYVSDGYLYSGQQDGNRIDIVYGEDNKVYMKNILCGSGSYFGESWVEGTIEGNEIHVPLGQSIYWSDQYQANVVLAMGNTIQDEDGYWGIEIDDRATEAVYVIEGETIALQGTEDLNEADDLFGYGLTAYWEDDDSWSGFIEWNTVFTEREPVVTPTVITEQPEGELVVYQRSGDCIYSGMFGLGITTQDGKINVVYAEDGKAYIQNPLWWFDGNNSWVEGTYDEATGIITVPTGQYLNWYESSEYGVQLMWGSTYVYLDTDENGEEGYYLGNEVDERTTEIMFQVDGDKLILLGSEGDANLEFPENYNATGLYAMWSDNQTWAGSLEFNTVGQHVDLVPAVPANPVAVEWYDEGDESGWNTFDFMLPTTDVDGNAIDPEYLSYSIFVDNGNGPELFTFPAATYTYDLTEDITEVPYSLYSSAVDFHASYVYFYRTNAEGYEPLFTENIGIQAYYTVNGVKNESEIAWLYEPQPQEKSYQLVMLDMNGNPVVYDLTQGENGEYTTTVALNYDVFGGFDPMTEERPAVPFYFLVNGVRYGANADMTAAVLGMAMENPLAATDGCYTVPVGYNYNIGIAIGLQGEMYAYVAQAGFTGVNDINAGKTVANVRYYNVTGQEMAQPAGMTIQVTTYTDGTTSTAKVVK